jgi:hypothetical protein
VGSTDGRWSAKTEIEGGYGMKGTVDDIVEADEFNRRL